MSEFKTRSIRLRVTNEELATLRVHAKTAGLTMSKWMLTQGVNQPVSDGQQLVIDSNQRLAKELAAVGNNINQIAHALNYANKTGEAVNNEQILASLKDAVKALEALK